MRMKKMSLALLLAVVLCICLTSLAFADEVTGQKFSVSNMFPGDSFTEAYKVTVNPKKATTLNFDINIHTNPEYTKLAEVLKAKVQLGSTVIYNGLMRDMPQHSTPLSAGRNTLHYTITVYLDTSVGNDYMGKTLVGDFVWWYSEDSSGGGSGGGGGGGYVPPSPPTVKPENPKTGDTFSAPLYIGVSVAAMFAILLLVRRKKKEDPDYE